MTLEELTAIRRNAVKWEWLARLDSLGWLTLALTVYASTNGSLLGVEASLILLIIPPWLAAFSYSMAFGMVGWGEYRQARRQLYLAEFYLGEPHRPRDSVL